MSLSEIHNPKAAAELIDRFRKRFKSKVCMAPHTDHEGPIISAHTLSVEAMLRHVAVDAHVYVASQAKRIERDTFPIEVQRRGLRDVTIFNGFCQKHDRELFACLETEPFRFYKQQNFMLAYRAVARECYLKRKQYESLPTLQEFANIHGITDDLQYSEATLIFQAACLSGAEDVEKLKVKFDQYLLAHEWDRVVTSVILFPNKPTVLAATAFQPFFDMNGKQLQDFEDLDADMSQICMSVIPIETGGAAIFSWLDSSNSAPARFFESVTQAADLTSAVVHAIFDNTENIAMNPAWYEALTETERQYLFSRMMLFAQSVSYVDRCRPDQSAPKVANWGQGVVSTF
ncbi:MAG: hypothetical protein HGA87_02340 [Desulfobulbaceae bacterium]|nr:hypothetical protein [Desulfobulbaceae bacterium]